MKTILNDGKRKLPGVRNTDGKCTTVCTPIPNDHRTQLVTIYLIALLYLVSRRCPPSVRQKPRWAVICKRQYWTSPCSILEVWRFESHTDCKYRSSSRSPHFSTPLTSKVNVSTFFIVIITFSLNKIHASHLLFVKIQSTLFLSRHFTPGQSKSFSRSNCFVLFRSSLHGN